MLAQRLRAIGKERQQYGRAADVAAAGSAAGGGDQPAGGGTFQRLASSPTSQRSAWARSSTHLSITPYPTCSCSCHAHTVSTSSSQSLSETSIAFALRWPLSAFKNSGPQIKGGQAPKCALCASYHGHALLIFTQEARSRLRALRPGLVVEVPRAKYQKLT